MEKAKEHLDESEEIINGDSRQFIDDEEKETESHYDKDEHIEVETCVHEETEKLNESFLTNMKHSVSAQTDITSVFSITSGIEKEQKTAVIYEDPVSYDEN